MPQHDRTAGARRTRQRAVLRRLAFGVIAAVSIVRVSAQIVPGPNVNMVAGRTWPFGDPFLQKQDEGSIAVSSRNVLHLVGSANDYRTVDLPGLPTGKATGDAWLGLFKSFDGGKTWTSTLIPGYPQDASAIGMMSPLRGYDAGADPLVRAGSNGLFYYSGIVFQRAAIQDTAPVGAAPGDASKKGLTKRDRKRDREHARQLERKREREREKERERRRKLERARKGEPARDGAANRRPPEEPADGGFDDDEEAGVDGTKSAIFVSTLIDLNNRENGDPISLVRTTLVDRDRGDRFLDKQWMAVDVPRAGAQMCVLDVPENTGGMVRQSFPGGRVYVVYTAFTGAPPNQKAQILFAYSSDCGVTWSRPHDISTVSDPDVTDDGVVNNADVNLIKASFGKQCGDEGFNPTADTNGDCIVNVIDLTFVSRSVGRVFPTTPRRIPQGANIAIDPLTGSVYVAWREFKTATQPDAIQVVRSTDFGVTFSTPRTIVSFSPFDQKTSGTTFRTSAFPTLAADGQRVYAAWSARGFAAQRGSPVDGDARIMMSTSPDGLAWTQPRVADEGGVPGHQIMPALTFGAGKISLLYYDLREDVSRLFQKQVDEQEVLADPLALRHTMDARIGQADPGVAPVFSSVRLSSYSSGVLPGSNQVQQLQFNPPNLKIAQKGGAAFMGDYVDVTASPTIRANDDGTWAFNIEPTTSSAGHAIWTDNRDVRAGPGGDLTNYTPPNSASRHDTSLYDPTQILPPCVADFTGTRDQNVYTARFDNGLFAGALGNSKPLDDVQRAFALFVENATTRARSYRLSIPQQPTGGQATFQQFSAPQAPVTRLDVTIPPRSTIARSVYVNSTVAMERVVVNVDEIDAPQAPAPIPGGRHGAILINGDSSAPAIENPAIENPAIENKPIATVEVYTPIVSKGVSAPAIENPAIENPAIENKTIPSVSEANASIVHPAIENPAIENVVIRTPAIENPAIENIDLVNGSISDTTWELTNGGNTAAAFAVKLLLNAAIPQGFKTQLVIHKTYTTPAADGCDLKSQLHNVVLLNIISPAFTDPARAGEPAIENPAIENATVALAPGEIANVTFRVFDPNKNDAVTFDTLAAVTPVAVAQSVNSEDAHDPNNPNPQPPVAIGLTISPLQVPDAFLTGGQYQQILRANVPGTWAITAGTLPPGLSLNAATGQISGEPTAAGTFTFTITFTDTAAPPHTTSQVFTMRVGGPLAIATTSVPDVVANVSNLVAINATGGIGALSWAVTAGTLPPGMSLNGATGAIFGTPTVAGVYPFAVTVRDSGVPQSSISQSYTLNVTGETFDKVWSGIDTIWENPANWSPAGIPTAATTVLIPGGLTRQPILSSDVAVSDLHLAPGATLETNGHQITVSGNLDAGNTIVGSGAVRMIGAAASLKGTVPNLIVAGGVSLNGDVHVNGDLTVDGALHLLGFPIVVTGRVISLTNPLARVDGGARALSTTDVAGEWSGTILTSTGGPVTSFPATFTLQQAGTHLTARSPQFPGTVLEADQIGVTAGGAVEFNATVTATTAGACSPAHFTGVLTIDPAANLLSGTVSGANTDCSAESNTFTLRNGSTLTAGGVNTNGLTIDNVVVTFDSGAIEQFDNVVFQSSLPEVLQLRINHPGTPGALSFSGVRFFVTPTTGFYIFATDTAPPDGNVLTIDLHNATADNGPAHTLVAGGAVVNWIGQAADLSLSQLRAPTVVFAGNSVTYTVTVTNNGPNVANDVTVVDTLPAGTTFVSVTPSQGSCGLPVGGAVTCSLGVVASGGSATMAIVVQTSAAGPIQNAAVVSSITVDPVAANNVSTDTTTVQVALAADVSISKSHVPLQPVVGQNLTYVVTVTNNGPATATQVVVTDTLPASVTFVSVSDASCSHVGAVVTCPVNSLANGASATFSITVTPTVAQPITNNASVSAAQVDPVVANNTASDPAMILAFAPCSEATFSGPTTYTVGPTSGWLPVTADLNHDGHPDIVVNGGATANSVTVLLGNGAGGFGPPTSYDAGGSTRWPAVADFDGDGHPDIAVSNFTGNSIVIFRGDGAGNFTLVPSIGTAGIASPFFLGTANLNGDAKPDLVAGSPSGSVVLLNQSTPGAFAFSATTYPQTSSGASAILADFDGDGDVDIALGKTTANVVTILLNDGSGAFATSMQAPAAPATFAANVDRVRDIGDLNGDGRVDLGVKLHDGSFQVLLRNPAGGFNAPVQVTAPSAAFAGFDVGFEASADFNGDGKLDLVREVFATTSMQMAMEVLLGDGTGTNFTPSASLLTTLEDKFVIADFNSDGKPDLAGFRTDVPSLLLFLNTCGTATAADLAVSMSGPATVNNGTAFSYTVTVTNHGPDLATNVVVTDAMPFQGMTLTGGSSTQGACTRSGNTLTCNVGALANGGSATITVNVQPIVGGGTLTNAALATANEADPHPANNSATASTSVNAGAATLVVTNTNDSGLGSLRQAIADSNLNTGVGIINQIRFGIAGTAPFTIAPIAPLPPISARVAIDGTSQPGFSGTPIIELTGSNVMPTGLSFTSASSVTGLVINRFVTNGIVIGASGAGSSVFGNYIGTDVAGTTARPNGRGINISSGNSSIVGNVISGNTSQGILITGVTATNNAVVTNKVGTNASGTAALGNGGDGVLIQSGASGNFVGGANAGDGNVISGNQFGMSITSSNGNSVQGNFIGTNFNGTAAIGNLTHAINLNTNASTNSVIGNVVSGNVNGIIVLTGATNNLITGNFVGTNASGSNAIPNADNGVLVQAPGNRIGATGGGNVISGNGGNGIFVSTGGSSTVIQGNKIGTNAAGAAAIANGTTGIGVNGDAGNVLIGGTAAGAGNLISGNAQGGIGLFQATVHDTIIQGNLIGTNAVGTAAIANGTGGVSYGVSINGPTNTLVGGPTATPGARNVIAGNNGFGVFVVGGSSGSQIKGNYIGVTASGTSPLGNTGAGVYVSNASSTVVGGTTADANIIGASGNGGVLVFTNPGDSTTGTVIAGNYIGTDSTATLSLGNAFDGVAVQASAGATTSNTTIGGVAANTGNVIARNGGSGVTIREKASATAVRGNAIFSNGGLGIDLSPGLDPDGITQNDAGDGDIGANNLQNFPLLARANPGSVVAGTLNSTASTTFALDFFANASCDPSGNGEGQRYLGSSNVTTNASGDISFSVNLSGASVVGEFITATATDANGNTSEFSPCVAVTNAGAQTFTVTTTADSGAGSLRQAILNSNLNTGFINQITFNIPGTGPFTIAPTTTLPELSARAFINGATQPGFTGTPIIELTGSGTIATGLSFTASSSVRGLVINRFTGSAIIIRNGGDGSTVFGNYLGTDVTGTVARPNNRGVEVGSSNVTVGPGNVISKNSSDGILIDGASATNVVVVGNKIGTNASGTAGLGNSTAGIFINNGASGNVIGGQNPGDGNVIAGSQFGIWLNGAGNAVRGNLVGTNVDGTVAIPNTGSGILIDGNNNTIGGAAAGAGNVISGNTGAGVFVSSTATGTIVQGNKIGTNAPGTAAIGNTSSGVTLAGSNNTIGGTSAAAGNVISGNGGNGVDILNGANGNIVQSNFVGTNSNGSSALANAFSGVVLKGSNNTIGGIGVGNVLSGNSINGINPFADNGTVVANNQIIGNIIGLNAAGTAAVPNGGPGIGHGINGTGTFGFTRIEGNVISGNGNDGLSAAWGGTFVIAGNSVGTNPTGFVAIPNARYGVLLANVSNSTIGGTTSAERNVISGNGSAGIFLSAGVTNATVQGNYIGVNAAGTAAIGNASSGVLIGNATNTTIGGVAPGAGNVISGNGTQASFGDGIDIFAGGSHVVQGNLIGTNASGTAAIPNVNRGVSISSSNNNTIGGTSAQARNVISGNGAFGFGAEGVSVYGTSNGNRILGNYIGTDITGASALGNTGRGVTLSQNSTSTIVGGIAAGSGNVISGNGTPTTYGAGINVFESSTLNVIQGNLIGTNAAGTAALPNRNEGIALSTNNNTLGGIAAGAGNVVAFNQAAGIGISAGVGNAVRGNAVYSNTGLGIDLGGLGVTANDAGDTDAGANNLQNFPVLTLANPSTVVAGTLNSAANTTFALDFYANAACDASGNGEGQRYLGSSNVTTNGSGDASFSITLAGASSIGEFITATATDPNGNTSEFSGCRVVTAAAAPGPTDVGVTLSANPNPIAAGATLTYTMTVTNNGASNQATGVTATQTLPSGVTFLSASSEACALFGAVVVCNLSPLNPSASVVRTIQVRPDVGGVTLVSSAHVDTATADPTPGNNDASATTSVTGAGTRQVWVADAGAPNRISIIDPDTNTAAGSINLAAPAYDVAFSPNGPRAYVVNFTTNNIAVIDTATNAIVANVPVTQPVRVKVSPDGSKFYVSNGANQLSVFNAQTNTLITPITVGGSPAGVAVSPDGRRVYVTNRDSNSVSVIDATTNTVVATVSVGDFPVAVAVTPNGKRVFVSNYFSANVSVIDTASNTVVATPDVTAGPQDLAVTPNGSKVYVANFDGNVVSVITVATNVVSPTIAVSGSPNGIVVSPDGDRVYVTAYNAGVVRVIDTATNAITTSVAAGNFPIAADYVRRP